MRDDRKMIAWLLERQPLTQFLDIRLLDLAAENGNKQLVMLITDVAVKTKTGMEDIAVWAMKKGYHHILRDLLRAGLSAKTYFDRNDRTSLLHAACREGKVPLAKGLIQAGADVNAVNTRLNIYMTRTCMHAIESTG